MTTFSDLVNDVFMVMEGYGLDQDRAAFLASDITSGATSAQVNDASNLAAGLAEIQDELVYIQAVDYNTNTVTFSPDGRGYRGTTAASHTGTTRVTMTPVLPRTLVKRKINETIVGLYPTCWGQGSTGLVYDPVTIAYSLPAEVEEVVALTVEDPGPTKAWVPVRRWNLDSTADTTDFPTGKVLNIWENLLGATDVRVVYKKRPTELAADADDLTSVSGLNASARAVIVAGTVWRLASFMDVSRLKVNTAVVDQLDEKNPIGTGTQVSSYLRKQYERELADEQIRQQLDTPPIIFYQE